MKENQRFRPEVIYVFLWKYFMCFLPEVFFALRVYFKELQLKGNLFDYP